MWKSILLGMGVVIMLVLMAVGLGYVGVQIDERKFPTSTAEPLIIEVLVEVQCCEEELACVTEIPEPTLTPTITEILTSTPFVTHTLTPTFVPTWTPTRMPTSTPTDVLCYQIMCHKPGTSAEQNYCCDSQGCIEAHSAHGDYEGGCR